MSTDARTSDKQLADELRASVARTVELMNALRDRKWTVYQSITYNDKKDQFEPHVEVNRREEI
jgi:hypothetical protein